MFRFFTRLVGAAVNTMPPPLAPVAGPVGRFVVNAYHHIDTGGPEALVQLALSLDSLCPNSTHLSLRPINPRLAAEYPKLRRLPMEGYDSLRSGDVYIFPETVSCDESLGRRGVRSFVYILSAKARRRNWQSLRKGCRLLSHNFWGAQHTNAGLSLPRDRVVRPYISPSIKARPSSNPSPNPNPAPGPNATPSRNPHPYPIPHTPP